MVEDAWGLPQHSDAKGSVAFGALASLCGVYTVSEVGAQRNDCLETFLIQGIRLSRMAAWTRSIKYSQTTNNTNNFDDTKSR